ncbi:MAG: hypothetical protein R2746_08820 [Acidimicrobiales bacterium]
MGDTDVLVKALARAREERKAIDRKAKRTAPPRGARRDDVRDATAYLAGARDNQRDLVDQVNVEIFNEATALRAVQGKKALIEGRINAEMTTSDGVAMILADRQKDQPDWVPGDVEITTPIPGYRIGSAFGPGCTRSSGSCASTPVATSVRPRGIRSTPRPTAWSSWPRCAAATATPP